MPVHLGTGVRERGERGCGKRNMEFLEEELQRNPYGRAICEKLLHASGYKKHKGVQLYSGSILRSRDLQTDW